VLAEQLRYAVDGADDWRWLYMSTLWMLYIPYIIGMQVLLRCPFVIALSKYVCSASEGSRWPSSLWIARNVRHWLCSSWVAVAGGWWQVFIVLILEKVCCQDVSNVLLAIGSTGTKVLVHLEDYKVRLVPKFSDHILLRW
jgi:hypothetical protein